MNDLGAVPLKNIAEPMRAYSLEVGAPSAAKAAAPADAAKVLTSKPRWLSGPLAAVGDRPAKLAAANGMVRPCSCPSRA